MAANTGTINLTLTVKDDGSISIDRFAKNAKGEIDTLSKTVKSTLGGAFEGIKSILGGIFDQIFSLKGLIAGLGLGLLAKNMIGISSDFEQMQMSINALTSGKGEYTFEQLTSWAKDLSIEVKTVTNAYKVMKASGLDPTLNVMSTMVGTMRAIGADEQGLLQMIDILGRIQSKKTASVRDLIALAQMGIPVFDILRERLNLTKQEILNLDEAGIESAPIIEALFSGLQDRFKYSTEDYEGTWKGMWENIGETWDRFKKMLMDAGLFKFLKDSLKEVNNTFDDWEKTGKLQAWAKQISETVTGWLFDVRLAIAVFIYDAGGMENILNKIGQAAKDVGVIFHGLAKAIEAAASAMRWYNEQKNVVASKDFTDLWGTGAPWGAPGGINVFTGKPYSSEQGPTGTYGGTITGDTINNNVSIQVQGTSPVAQSIPDLARALSRQMQTLQRRGY